jgi:succinylglutamate desuccinylase
MTAPTVLPIVPPAVAALAAGDVSALAARFAAAGHDVQLPAAGMLQVRPVTPVACHLLISVGIHGDETAPIEILAELLEELAAAPHTLGVNLMVVVGNLAAIAQGRRYIDADLNRMFSADLGAELGNDLGTLARAADAPRAAVIMAATSRFFGATSGLKWHLDLHTAIRASAYPAFAIVPVVTEDERHPALLSWLGSAGIGAVVINTKTASTFSTYTATQWGATSCTVELGRVGVLGANTLDTFAPARAALRGLLRAGPRAASTTTPVLFDVAQELIKHSDGFRLQFDRATQNFTALAAGSIIACDGDVTYRVGPVAEHVIFPNPDVRIGLRAGLMVVPRTQP